MRLSPATQDGVFSAFLKNCQIALEDEELSAFLKKYPIPLHHSKPESYGRLWVFWSKDEELGSEINSSSSSADTDAHLHPPPMPYHIIKSAFSKMSVFRRGLIFQLWAPTGGRRLLSTSNQPFALGDIYNDDVKNYRLRSIKYQYSIDNQFHIQQQQQEEENPIILTGGPTAAFHNRMTEFAFLKDNPLRHSVMVPICYPSQTSSCIAVVECTLYDIHPHYILVNMRKALEEAGLSICPVQERIPYKTINGLKPTRDHIQAALKTICESHDLQLAQVWIPYADENHVPFSSSMEDTGAKHTMALKLTGYVNKGSTDFVNALGDYSYIFDMVYLKAGRELVEKTLQDSKPRYFIDISYRYNGSLLSYYSRCSLSKISYLAICLRSTDTGDLDYAFDFAWRHTPEHVTLLESLLLTLKSCLPRFKFAFGVELGNELEILVVDYSPYKDTGLSDELQSHSDAEYVRGNKTRSLKIFLGKKSSPLPIIAMEAGNKPMVMDSCKAKWKTAPKELSKEDLEKQFGNTMKEAAENLKVSLSTLKRKCKGFEIYEWQGRPNAVKRKVNPSSNSQRNINEEDDVAIQEPSVVNRNENTLTIKAEYADDMIKFDLHASQASFDNVQKEIGKKLSLSPGTYNLKYLDRDGDLILLTSDQDMSDCIKYFITLGQPVVRLQVIFKVTKLV